MTDTNTRRTDSKSGFLGRAIASSVCTRRSMPTGATALQCRVRRSLPMGQGDSSAGAKRLLCREDASSLRGRCPSGARRGGVSPPPESRRVDSSPGSWVGSSRLMETPGARCQNLHAIPLSVRRASSTGGLDSSTGAGVTTEEGLGRPWGVSADHLAFSDGQKPRTSRFR
jgi:hypothetical protein